MPPIRKGDGTAIAPKGIAEVRKGDGTVLYSAGPAIPDSPMDHYWPTLSDTGATLIDQNGSLDISLNGPTTTSGAGIDDHYSDYDGSSDYGIDIDSVYGSADFALACWFNPDSTSGLSDYLNLYDNSTASQAVTLRINDGNLQLFGANAAGGSNININGMSVSAGTWYFTGAVGDFTTGEIDLVYASASDSNPTTQTSTNYSDSSSITAANSIQTGAQDEGATRQYGGGMDAVQFSAGVESISDIESFFDDSKEFFV